jgi:hypothetical protein
VAFLLQRVAYHHHATHTRDITPSSMEPLLADPEDTDTWGPRL